MGRIQNTLDFFSSLYKTIRFRYHRKVEVKKFGHYQFPYNEELKDKTAYVLANGPSLKEEISVLLCDECFSKAIKCALNYFAESSLYETIKPDLYFLADPCFFRGKNEERDNKMIIRMNSITSWSIVLYVPYYHVNIAKTLIKNNNIKVVPVPTLLFEGFEEKRYIGYKKGIAVPSFVNVTIMAEYVLLNLGCKDIRLYGVDHTFFNGIAVDSNNTLCIIDSHFDGDRYIPVRGGKVSIANWLYDKYLTFLEHENIRKYADFLNAKIINCTKSSLIDSYTRLSQLVEE